MLKDVFERPAPPGFHQNYDGHMQEICGSALFKPVLGIFIFENHLYFRYKSGVDDYKIGFYSFFVKDNLYFFCSLFDFSTAAPL